MELVRELVVRAATAPTRADRIEAYGRLVELFRDMACGYAYSIVGDFHLAEDVAQEAFILAFEKLRQLREPAAFPGWFRRIVWTACGRMVRRSPLPAVGLAAAADVPAGGPGPDQLAERREMRDEVLRAIGGLPPAEREATTLFYINGYSQKDIADFLEVPVGTVKNRLAASRGRLKERMLHMVEDTLHQNAPDERFNRAVIGELLSRPRPLDMPGHPSRVIWDRIVAAMKEYEVVAPGDEVEDEQTAREAEDHAWDYAYHPSTGKALRFQMTTVAMAAIRGKNPPVRILTAGRVFRPVRSETHRINVFHQMDGVCIEAGADVPAFKATCERIFAAAVPGASVQWLDHDTSFVTPGFQAILAKNGLELEILGGGMLRPETLLNKGFDPKAVSGYSWGLSLDRLAMLRFGIDDISKLWQPPYIP